MKKAAIRYDGGNTTTVKNNITRKELKLCL